MAKVSVVVPVYNVEEYLERCIESIRNQTLEDIEIILVDDGSPDNCPKICDEFAEKDSRIKVVHKKNAGVAAARNSGLEIATGEYIAFVDSDDYIDKNMYQRMMEKVQEYDCDLVMCDCVKEYGDHQEIYTHNIRGNFYNLSQLREEYYPQLLISYDMEYPATISNVVCLFKHNTFRRGKVCYMEGIRFSEDWLLGAQMMLYTNSFCYMKGEAYYHYRMNEQSATHTFVPDKWNDYCRMYEQMSKIFLKVEDYDFEEQLNRVLLFLVYNAVGDYMRAENMDSKQRKRDISEILASTLVRKMFKKISIWKLKIHWKLKIITLLYKYQIGLGLLLK